MRELVGGWAARADARVERRVWTEVPVVIATVLLALTAVGCGARRVRDFRTYHHGGELESVYRAYSNEFGRLVLDGRYRFYWSNGVLALEKDFRHGQEVGRETRWNAEGRKVCERDASDEKGRAHGRHVTFGPGGGRVSESFFWHGYEVGTWSWWTADGKLLAQGNYKPFAVVDGQYVRTRSVDTAYGTTKWQGTFVELDRDRVIYIERYEKGCLLLTTREDGRPLDGDLHVLSPASNLVHRYRSGHRLYVGPSADQAD
jgi:antitoxin component YwqK of YwqJK toxin-antitoxin module